MTYDEILDQYDAEADALDAAMSVSMAAEDAWFNSPEGRAAEQAEMQAWHDYEEARYFDAAQERFADHIEDEELAHGEVTAEVWHAFIEAETDAAVAAAEARAEGW